MRALLTAALLALGALPAHARHGFDVSGDYLMAGLDLGVTIDDDAGALLGVELSYVELDAAGPWIGLFVTGAWASDLDVGRFTVGPEIGYGFGGIDGGVSVDTDGTLGGRARAMLSVGVASLYVGAAFGGGTRAEVGLLIKAPIEL